MGVYQYSKSILKTTDEKQLRLEDPSMIKKETDKAILIQTERRKSGKEYEFWVPKSQIEIEKS